MPKIKISKKSYLKVEPNRIGFDLFVKGQIPTHYPYNFRHAVEYLLLIESGKKAKNIKELQKNFDAAVNKIIKEVSE